MTKYSAVRSAKSFLAMMFPQLTDGYHKEVVKKLSLLLVHAYNEGYKQGVLDILQKRQ